ncbi:MAG: hypothetical protein PVJ01_06645 [Pseudomonadota bacterium]|jgi:hypothetical protein
MSDYRNEWKSYRRRVWITAGAWAIPPVMIYLSGAGGRLFTGLVCAWLLAFTASMVWLFSFRCPRCQEWFFIRFPTNHPLTRVCVHCGLPKHANKDPDLKEGGG